MVFIFKTVLKSQPLCAGVIKLKKYPEVKTCWLTMSHFGSSVGEYGSLPYAFWCISLPSVSKINKHTEA